MFSGAENTINPQILSDVARFWENSAPTEETRPAGPGRRVGIIEIPGPGVRVISLNRITDMPTIDEHARTQDSCFYVDRSFGRGLDELSDSRGRGVSADYLEQAVGERHSWIDESSGSMHLFVRDLERRGVTRLSLQDVLLRLISPVPGERIMAFIPGSGNRLTFFHNLTGLDLSMLSRGYFINLTAENARLFNDARLFADPEPIAADRLAPNSGQSRNYNMYDARVNLDSTEVRLRELGFERIRPRWSAPDLAEGIQAQVRPGNTLVYIIPAYDFQDGTRGIRSRPYMFSTELRPGRLSVLEATIGHFFQGPSSPENIADAVMTFRHIRRLGLLTPQEQAVIDTNAAVRNLHVNLERNDRALVDINAYSEEVALRFMRNLEKESASSTGSAERASIGFLQQNLFGRRPLRFLRLPRPVEGADIITPALFLVGDSTSIMCRGQELSDSERGGGGLGLLSGLYVHHLLQGEGLGMAARSVSGGLGGFVMVEMPLTEIYEEAGLETETPVGLFGRATTSAMILEGGRQLLTSAGLISAEATAAEGLALAGGYVGLFLALGLAYYHLAESASEAIANDPEAERMALASLNNTDYVPPPEYLINYLREWL